MELMPLIVMVVVSAVLVAYGLMPAKGDSKKTLLRRLAGQKASDAQKPGEATEKPSAARKIMDKVAPFAMKPVMPKSDEEMSRLRIKLANAGFRRESATGAFLASKTLLAVGVAIGTGMYSWSDGSQTLEIFGMTATGAAVGFWLPNLWLALARSQRGEKIRNGLPDSLDLMVVSVEAGLALDAALLKVSEEMRISHPILAEEMTICTLETQMGIPRAEAMENMATRTGVPEMKALVAIVTQAERFGTSIAKALRNQANTLRVKRQQRAEERAQATTVKLMLPLILFIFPGIFIVLVGPAGIRLVRTLGQTGL